jgi:hypothetical protein
MCFGNEAKNHLKHQMVVAFGLSGVQKMTHWGVSLSDRDQIISFEAFQSF